jgi:hypothetical protein
MSECTAAAIVVFFANVLLWLRTGRSPFIWGALALLALEAARQQAFESVAHGARHFASNYKPRLAQVRREVMGEA